MANSNTHISMDDESIDIKKYIMIVLHHWWWFAITLFVSLSIAYLINRYSQEVYRIECSLIIGEEKSGAGTIEGVLDELSRLRSKRRKAVVENEISILKSYSMAKRSLEELDFEVTYTAVGRRNIAEKRLYKSSPFIVIPDTGQGYSPHGVYDLTIISKEKYQISVEDQDERIHSFGERIEFDGYRMIINLRNPSMYSQTKGEPFKYYFSINTTNGLANGYSSSLSVDLNAEKGTVLNLSLTGFVPEKISDYLNKICETYIRTNLEEKNHASVNSIRFIDDQLKGIVDSLELTGLRLQNFRSANKVIDISEEGSFLFQKLQDLQSEKTVLDVNLRYYEYLQEYINTKTDFSDVVAPSVIGIQDPLLTKLIVGLNDLNMQRRKLSLTVLESSPQLSLMNDEIANTHLVLKENLSSLIKTNHISTKELDERIEKIENAVQKLPGTERQLINIERKFTINDQIYTFLLEKRAEAGIALASNSSDHKILDPARPDNASLVRPNISMNYLIAMFIGGFIPLVLLIIIEYFNDKISDKKDIEQITKTPILGTIGHNDKLSDLPVFEFPKSALSESFRALRSNLQFLQKDQDNKTILISSTISGEGKTFCALNLATIIAMAGKKTLLISLDLRRPKIHRVFNIPNKVGLSTYLIKRCELDEVIHETNVNNLYIANSGPVPPNPAELIETEQMNKFMTEAKAQYDAVVIDTPPIGIVTDAMHLTRFSNMNVFVVRHDYSRKQVIKMIDELYRREDIENISLLVNDFQQTGYYGYQYNYNYNYGYYYGNQYYENDSKTKKSLIGKWLTRKSKDDV